MFSAWSMAYAVGLVDDEMLINKLEVIYQFMNVN
jgi:hypothetical protein